MRWHRNYHFFAFRLSNYRVIWMDWKLLRLGSRPVHRD
ncbi:unnamed protein product [Soboliphyme baturini]|uniref:Neur_chan_LBD domain-containing protein n=1 Tax=Soboliphyme baturini TaxID=241478 RepID=A0A183IA48_9BILA|nr:unnamed protein product [Soboliphyme baturini]